MRKGERSRDGNRALADTAARRGDAHRGHGVVHPRNEALDVLREVHDRGKHDGFLDGVDDVSVAWRVEPPFAIVRRHTALAAHLSRGSVVLAVLRPHLRLGRRRLVGLALLRAGTQVLGMQGDKQPHKPLRLDRRSHPARGTRLRMLGGPADAQHGAALMQPGQGACRLAGVLPCHTGGHKHAQILVA